MEYAVITQIIMKIILFWDVMPCRPLTNLPALHRKTHYFHLHGKSKLCNKSRVENLNL